MDKNLKSLIADEYAKVYKRGSSMHNYCVGKISDAVVLSNGWIYTFDKPSIKKSFCFGYRLGHDNMSEYVEANDMVSHVRNDGGEYFKRTNLESFANFDKDLKDNDFVAVLTYNGTINIATVITENGYRRFYCSDPNFYKLTKEDVENLIAVNASEKKKFEKRLDTYLKKYGTSKINSWSYWSDL